MTTCPECDGDGDGECECPCCDALLTCDVCNGIGEIDDEDVWDDDETTEEA